MEFVNSNNFINNGKKWIGFLPIEELIRLPILVPSIQRIKHMDKLKEIVNYQEEYFRENKCFNFLGLINLQYSKDNGNLYIIDGQHRYEAIKRLSEKKYHSEKIGIELIEVKNGKELEENYGLINKNTPLPEFSYEIPKDIIKDVMEYFQNKYGELITYKTKAIRPRISQNRFLEAVSYLYEELKIIESNDLIEKLEKINRNMRSWKPENFPKWNKLSNPERTLNMCKEFGLFLGMFNYENQDYCYEWVKLLIRSETGGEVKKKKLKKKKCIPKKIKEELWDSLVGKEKGITMCFCCQKVEIRQADFEAGHIIPECKGGTISINNLRPICRKCNSSMGSRNMDEYIRDFYKKNNL